MSSSILWPNDEFGEDFYYECEIHLALMMKGIRPNMPAVATLKDERRPLEKIALGKTRGFIACNAACTVITRMLMMRTLAAMRTTRFDVGCAVGMDPESFDMNTVAMKLLAVSNKIIESDFSDFDGTLHPRVMEGFFDFVIAYEKKCGLSRERETALRVLQDVIIHTDVIVLNAVFKKHMSNFSGFGGTTEMNVWAQLYAFYLAWLELAPPDQRTFGDWQRNVAIVCYGDDGVQAVSDEASHFYNMHTIAPVLKEKLGMKMTSADKKTEGIPPYKPLHECSFLKRRFIRGLPNGTLSNFWFGQLPWSTILEMTNWISSDDNPLLQAELNCNEALRFAGYHPKPQFDWLRETLLKAFAELNHYPVFFTYGELQEQIALKMGIVPAH